MKGIIDKWFENGVDAYLKEIDLKILKNQIKEKLDYWDRQPVTDEFSRGFEHSNKVIREFLFGKVEDQNTTNKVGEVK